MTEKKLGDIVSNVITAVPFVKKDCPDCQARREKLNEWHQSIARKAADVIDSLKQKETS